MENLKKELEKAVLGVIQEFEKKQDLYFEFAVKDDVTGVLCFSNEFFFDLNTICHDIFTEQSKGKIIEWHEYCLDHETIKINYNSYCMGCRVEQLKKD